VGPGDVSVEAHGRTESDSWCHIGTPRGVACRTRTLRCGFSNRGRETLRNAE
jgi:hypothetical protein